jgi:exonuclease III
MDRFRETLEHCRLKDMGYESDTFTWRNDNHVAENYIRERLDRVVANHQCKAHFPAARVINGDPHHSDHHPLIITT